GRLRHGPRCVFGVYVVVAVHADEKEGRAVAIRAPDDGIDVEGAAVRRTDAKLGLTADFQRCLHQADLGTHGTQVYRLELEMAVSDLEDYRPCNLGPRVPPQISPSFSHVQPPLLLGDSLTVAMLWQASLGSRQGPSSGRLR